MHLKCLGFCINRAGDCFCNNNFSYERGSSRMNNSNYGFESESLRRNNYNYGNSDCDFGSSFRRKRDNIPPYIKYFEERDYDTIRPAGLAASEIKQEIVGDVDKRTLYSNQDSSQQKKYKSYTRGFRKTDYSGKDKKKCVIFADVYLKDRELENSAQKTYKSEKQSCKKVPKRYKSPVSSNNENGWNIVIFPLCNQANAYDGRKCCCDDYKENQHTHDGYKSYQEISKQKFPCLFQISADMK